MTTRILVVDDDPSIRSTIAEVFGEDGTLEVGVAASAEEAIEIIDTETMPEIVFTDLRMRGLDGMDLLRVLRQRSPLSRVVMMTAYHDVGTAVGAMREGAVDFLTKPFDLRTLRSVLQRLLGRDETTGLPNATTAQQVSKTFLSRAPQSDNTALNNRYVVEKELGRGAMATVFRAHDSKHDRPVAVKVLRREVAAQVGAERFLREIRIAARLHHPHVLTLIDSGEWDGAPYFVMPFVDGPTLRDRLDADGPMEVSQAARLLRDVAEALAAAHAKGVVHRDVKPENILFSDGHAWIADFGVARALWDVVESRSTTMGLVVGTPHYMAPEQAAGQREIDHRADIYAVGVVAYELLTGQTPFTGETTRAILASHIVEKPPSLDGHDPDIPTDLQAVIMRCLDKEPGDRWADAETLARQFARFAVEEGVQS